MSGLKAIVFNVNIGEKVRMRGPVPMERRSESGSNVEAI